MSKLERLIAELCPNGVKFVPLGDVINYEQPTKYIVKSTDYNDEFNTPVLTAGQSLILGYTNETEGIYYASKDNPVIIFDDFTTSYHWVDYNFKVKSSAMKMLTPKETCITDFRYLYYAICCILYKPDFSKHERQWIGIYSRFQIPLPPLSIQQEIVRILDKFTELTAELASELKARKKQYEYYRNFLLTFSDTSDIIMPDSPTARQPDSPTARQPDSPTARQPDSPVHWLTLGEIATDMYRGAGIKRDEVTKVGAPCVRYGEIYTTYNIWFNICVSRTQAGSKTFEHGDVLFAITGENVEEIAKSCVYMGNEKCFAGGDIVVMKHNQNPKYLGYALSTINAQKQKSKGRVKSKVVHSSIPALKEIIIPIPPLEEQARIVSILDRFDALTTDISSGLPAEIAARQKQYEYYRDKLLTFKEIT
jgi:type I restriction enzyme S subunit